jgi:SAM-dependent methyltransferase
MFRRFVAWQRRLSNEFDRLLPEQYRRTSNFRATIVPRYLVDSTTIYDVGGGSLPCVDVGTKQRLHLHVVGLDIDAVELSKAPQGAYDRTIVSDISHFEGTGDADLVLCHAALEHVRCTSSAFRAMSTILKPGGRLVLFTPSRNAAFAWLNLLLPERVKRALLFALLPHKNPEHSGFPAYYDRCTPRDFRRLAEQHGLEVEDLKGFFKSSYFSVFLPLYVVWRLWILTFHRVAGEQAAETFVMVCRKR